MSLYTWALTSQRKELLDELTHLDSSSGIERSVLIEKAIREYVISRKYPSQKSQDIISSREQIKKYLYENRWNDNWQKIEDTLKVWTEEFNKLDQMK